MTFKLRPRHRLKQLQRSILIVGGASLIAAAAWMTFVITQTDSKESKAGSRRLSMHDPVNNGEIVMAFTWDENLPLQPEIGPVAQKISRQAICVPGGADSTAGLSAGKGMQSIELVTGKFDGMNDGGMDISIDFRRFEESGNFFSRGSTFNFGMLEGKLVIHYKLESINGRSYAVDQTTDFDVPNDTVFRNYRFIYKPNTGRGEILVNNVTVWFNQGVPQSHMLWKEKENFVIGKGMDGGGINAAIFDNFIVRKTSNPGKAPMELLSFTAELQGTQIMLNWFTARETGTESFKIERSTDTKVYQEIGTVQAAGISETLKAYALIDPTPVLGVSYYRLGLTNSGARSTWVPIIAFRLKPEQLPATPLRAATQPAASE